MSSRTEKAQKQLREKHQAILNELLKEDANRYCADCESKGPRWSSWNIGVFVCIRCAGIHRNLGVHISKVKSVNLDSWTPEQIEHIQKWGNKRCKENYECYLPDDFQRPHGDSAMEQFIRNKYERKLYKKKDGEPPPNKREQKESKKGSKPVISKEEGKKQTILNVADSGSDKQAETPPSQRKGNKPTSAIPRPHGSGVAVASAPVGTSTSASSSEVADLLSLDDHSTAPTTTSQVSSPSANELNLFGIEVSSPSQPTDLFQTSQGNTLTVEHNPHMTRSSSDSLLMGEPEKAMSTKESILSLYQSGNQNQQQKVYNVPGGMYMTHQKPMAGMYTGFHQMPGMHQQASPGGVRLPQPQGMHPMGVGQGGLVHQGHQPYQQMSHLNLQMHQLHLSHSLPSLHQAGYTGSPAAPSQGQPRAVQPSAQFSGLAAQQYHAAMGWNANQRMMQAQQPIPVNGPNMGFGSSPIGNMQNAGHTMNTQLWK